jgi:hypothetical protein
MISVSSGGINPALLNPLPGAPAPAGGSGIPQLDAAQFMQKTGAADVMAKQLAAMGLPPPATSSASNASMEAAIKALNDASGAAGTDLNAVMALLVKLANEQRDAAMTERKAAMQGQADALKGAADKMKQAAQERLTSAIVQGAFQIAGGLTQFGSAMGEAAKALPTALGQSQALGMAEAAAAAADIKTQQMETSAKMREAGVQSANDYMQQMMDIINDIRDKLAAISQAQSEVTRGIVRNV